MDDVLTELRSNGADVQASSLVALLESRKYFGAIGRVSTPDMPKVAELLLVLVGDGVLVVNPEFSENER